jgi:pimeloyl-[acyl-carrier protein] synthase
MDKVQIQDPYRYYARQRQKAAIHWSQSYRSWCIFDYKVGCEALTHHDVSSNLCPFLSATTFPDSIREEATPLISFLQQWLFYCDPPQHTQLRQQLNPKFSKQNIENHTDGIKAIIENVCTPQTGCFDFINQVANIIPPRVIALILDLPQTDAPLFLHWTEQLSSYVNAFVRSKNECRAAMHAVSEIKQYFTDQPALHSMLIATGIDTMIAFLSNMLYVLLKHPEQFLLLQQNRELVDSAINELLRFEPPAHIIVRMAKTDFTLHECNIKAGDAISIFLAAMNRDPNQFANPEQFDITREKNRHVAFGHGIHYCLGRLLAQTTGRILLNYMLDHWSHIQLSQHNITWNMGSVLRQIASLPVTLR